MDGSAGSNSTKPGDELHGKVIDEQRFVLEKRLGKGGTGDVYEALMKEEDGQTRIAIKVVADSPGEPPGRLRSICDQLRSLRHPNLLIPFEFIASSGGRVLLMEFIEGLSLGEFLRRLKRIGKPLPRELALEILGQALDGLEYLHRLSFENAPLTHRNIKPSNLLIGLDGVVRLHDIGVYNPLMEAAQRTKGLAVINVLPYMAPEQLNDPPKNAPATDVYSLGAVAYELLAGRPLFDGSAARRELDIRVGFGVQDKIKALESVVPGVEPLLSKALALNVADRFQSVPDMKAELRALRNTTERKALAALTLELFELPERPPMTVSRPADATTQVGAEPANPSVIREKLSANTVTRVVEPVPPGLLRNASADRANSQRLKVLLALLSLAIAFAAVWFVLQPV